MTEARTPREARLVIRDLERAVDRVRMAPAAALAGFSPAWYLHRAQAALRQAERAFAKADDPRLDSLKPLAPQVERPRRTSRPRRKRYRCTGCFAEQLRYQADVEREPHHTRMRQQADGNYERYCCGEWQLLPPLRSRS